MVLKKEVRIVMFSNGKTLSELFLLVSAFCFVVPCIKIYFWCEPETWATFYAFLPSYTFNSLLVLPSYKCAKREALLKLILKAFIWFSLMDCFMIIQAYVAKFGNKMIILC